MTLKLRSHLGRCFKDFNQLVDDAIAMEGDLWLHHLEKKKAKVTAGPSGSASEHPRLTYQAPSRPQQQMIDRPTQSQFTKKPQYYRPPQQQWNVRTPAPFQVPRLLHPCFNCGRVG